MKNAESQTFVNFQDEFIFVTGGIIPPDDDEGDFQLLTNSYRYRISDDTWSELPAFNHERYSHSSCVVQGTLYVIGGYGDFSAVGKIEGLAIDVGVE